MFKLGQKVVCISASWIQAPTKQFNTNSPKKDEIVTIRKISNDGFIVLDEYRCNEFGEQWFEAKWFKPLQYDKDATSEILSKFVTTEEKCDAPIKKEQPILQ